MPRQHNKDINKTKSLSNRVVPVFIILRWPTFFNSIIGFTGTDQTCVRKGMQDVIIPYIVFRVTLSCSCSTAHMLIVYARASSSGISILCDI